MKALCDTLEHEGYSATGYTSAAQALSADGRLIKRSDGAHLAVGREEMAQADNGLVAPHAVHRARVQHPRVHGKLKGQIAGTGIVEIKKHGLAFTRFAHGNEVVVAVSVAMAEHLRQWAEREDAFVQALAQHHGRESLTISPGALKWLQTLPWPGNIRQLKQWIERAALVTPAQVLDVDDFRATSEMEGAAPAAAPDPLPPVGSMTMEEIERAMILKSLRSRIMMR